MVNGWWWLIGESSSERFGLAIFSDLGGHSLKLWVITSTLNETQSIICHHRSSYFLICSHHQRKNRLKSHQPCTRSYLLRGGLFFYNSVVSGNLHHQLLCQSSSSSRPLNETWDLDSEAWMVSEHKWQRSENIYLFFTVALFIFEFEYWIATIDNDLRAIYCSGC